MAMIEDNFSRDEEDLAKWCIDNTNKVVKNYICNRTYLETAYLQDSQNIIYLMTCEFNKRVRTKGLIAKIMMSKTKIRKGVLEKICSFSVEEVSISTHFQIALKRKIEMLRIKKEYSLLNFT
mmetsp:Transcript_19781/g.17486  ORF Transcript_19781/g.17486 Transcript_19781/m.17486 type:complete len:122 (+) Transcript_19781:451-816(+)